jgi:hypothetical protein
MIAQLVLDLLIVSTSSIIVFYMIGVAWSEGLPQNKDNES